MALPPITSAPESASRISRADEGCNRRSYCGTTAYPAEDSVGASPFLAPRSRNYVGPDGSRVLLVLQSGQRRESNPRRGDQSTVILPPSNDSARPAGGSNPATVIMSVSALPDGRCQQLQVYTTIGGGSSGLREQSAGYIGNVAGVVVCPEHFGAGFHFTRRLVFTKVKSYPFRAPMTAPPPLIVPHARRMDSQTPRRTLQRCARLSKERGQPDRKNRTVADVRWTSGGPCKTLDGYDMVRRPSVSGIDRPEIIRSAGGAEPVFFLLDCRPNCTPETGTQWRKPAECSSLTEPLVADLLIEFILVLHHARHPVHILRNSGLSGQNVEGTAPRHRESRSRFHLATAWRLTCAIDLFLHPMRHPSSSCKFAQYHLQHVGMALAAPPVFSLDIQHERAGRLENFASSHGCPGQQNAIHVVIGRNTAQRMCACEHRRMASKLAIHSALPYPALPPYQGKGWHFTCHRVIHSPLV